MNKSIFDNGQRISQECDELIANFRSNHKACPKRGKLASHFLIPNSYFRLSLDPLQRLRQVLA
jgi:hypothetical protein